MVMVGAVVEVFFHRTVEVEEVHQWFHVFHRDFSWIYVVSFYVFVIFLK
jgi:hypothetical protein